MLYGAASHQEASTRNAIHLSAWSAAARAQIGDVGGAVDEGLPVLASLASVSSTRTLKVLEPVRSAVDGLALGDEFRGRFDSLTKAIAS
ncbi:hypothetical protein ACWDOP_07905 [Nocardia sp. NPDC003693]